MPKRQLTIEQARTIAKEVAEIRVKWGRMGVGPYSIADLSEVITVLYSVVAVGEKQTQDELVRLRRQLAAANARVARLSKRAGIDPVERSIDD
jgi:hypothetical protein